jgi:uncharacterized protein
MHHRLRHIERILDKRSMMFPTLGVLGPRQVGKSTFLMKQWKEKKSAAYITFDKQETAVRAKRSPELLLLEESSDQQQHLIIDEAQKVPHIFDSLKSIIDQKRRMGAFTLSGSIEFSSKSGVRESLAGRMGITRMYPMTLREITQEDFKCPWLKGSNDVREEPLKIKSIETWLDRGGMPVFCGISDKEERIQVINSWLEEICYRDLQQMKGAKYNSELAFEILRTLAVEPHLSISKLASGLGASHESIGNHLMALEALFLIYKIPSFENPRAVSMYRLFDSGVLNALVGGQETIFSRKNSLISLVINEIYAQHEYEGKLKPKISHYSTRGGAEIDLVVKSNDKLIGIECMASVDINHYQQRGMKSFLKKYDNAIGYFIVPGQEFYKLDTNLFVVPWTYIG